MAERSARLFINGKNQAVRLPKDLEFQGVNEVLIKKEGKSLILTPLRKSWLSFADLPGADEDFMASREDFMDETRVKF